MVINKAINEEKKKKMEKIIRFFKDEDGLELSEYAVMGFLIIVTIVGAVTALRARIAAVFAAIVAALT